MATTIGASKPAVQKPKQEERKSFFSDKAKKGGKDKKEESAED